MGYRHYFKLVEKTKLKELKSLTMDDIQKEYDVLPVDNTIQDGCVRKSYEGKLVGDVNDYVYARYSILLYDGQIIHELGKLYWDDTEKRLLETCEKIDFADESIEQRLTADHCLVVASVETLKKYAFICMEKMIAYQESLLTTSEKSNFLFLKMEKELGEGKTQEEKDKILYRKLKTSIEEEIRYRKSMLAINQRKDNKDIHTTEYYGEIAMKIKTIIDFNVIDFEKYELILCAW